MTEEHAAAAQEDPDVPASVVSHRVLLHMPVDIRNVSLVVLAVPASLLVLHWARAVFIPVMLSVMFSYALSPVVNCSRPG